MAAAISQAQWLGEVTQQPINGLTFLPVLFAGLAKMATPFDF
jgi:hypothetical protein